MPAALVERAPRCEGEVRNSRPDGTMLWLRRRGEIARDDPGRPARMHGACIAFTARKTAGEELRQLSPPCHRRRRGRGDRPDLPRLANRFGAGWRPSRGARPETR